MCNDGPMSQPWLQLRSKDFLECGGNASKRGGGRRKETETKARKANISILDIIHK